MNIGKQSTLNDLSDLKTDLETKIEAARVTIIEETATGGAITLDSSNADFSGAVSGAVTLTTKLQGSDLYPTGATARAYGFVAKNSTGDGGVALMSEDWGRGAISYKTIAFSNVSESVFLLSTANTITDANGFIKAA